MIRLTARKRIILVGNPWISFGITYSFLFKSLSLHLPLIIIDINKRKLLPVFEGLKSCFDRKRFLSLPPLKKYCKTYKYRIRIEFFKRRLAFGIHIDDRNPHIELFFGIFRIDLGYLPTLKEYRQYISEGAR